MKTEAGWIVLALVAGATVLLYTLSARAAEGRRPDDVVEVQTTVTPETVEDTVILDIGETLGSEAPPEADAPAPTEAQMLESLVAISPAGGKQLPAPADVDVSTWQRVDAGHASMRVPADWVVQNRIGEPGDDDQTIGLSPEAQDLYIELRQIRNADSNYMQTVLDHARSEYARSPDRLAEGVILGFAPKAIDGAIGGVEIMNQFGKPVDENGQPTFRLVLWRGRWERDDAIQRVEFTATFAQDRHEEFAPLVARILETVRIDAPAE
jgi:hypothetical protein